MSAARRLGVARALVDGREVPGDVTVAGDRIAGVGVLPAGPAGTAVPGFVDLQVNGYAGVDFLRADPADIARAVDAMAAAGVTSCQPTLITAPVAELERAVRAVEAARARAGPRILGVHLEGPFLSPAWPGAHPAEHLRAPDGALLARLRAAGTLAAVTLAPELDGALGLVRDLARSGVTVHVGHTDADAAVAHAAFDAGARVLTHVHNAHRRFAPRDPGPAGVALTRADVTVTAIVDGVHLAPETATIAWRAAGERLALITDAIAAAGMGDGTFTLGDRTATVRDGASRLDDGRLAGSVVTMDGAVRQLVSLGATPAQAVHAASGAAAHATSRTDLGRLAPGAPADVAVLDEELRVVRTLVAGAERFAAA